MNPIQVLISSPRRLLMDSLIHAVDTDEQITVLRPQPGASAAEAALSLAPDIVILEIHVSNMADLETVRQILSADSGTRIIALSDTLVPHHVWRMVNLGVSGYLLTSNPLKDLMTAIGTVASGELYLSPEIAGKIVQTMSATPQKDTLFSLLSGREREVLQLVAEGYRTKEIAKKLYISPKTVQIHQSNLKKKLNLTNTAELTRYAVKNGITPLEYLQVPPEES